MEQPKNFRPFFVFFRTISPPHRGHLIPTVWTIGLVYLHFGKLLHATNFPYRPIRSTSAPPHSGHFSPVSLLGISILDTFWRVFRSSFSNDCQNVRMTDFHGSLPSAILSSLSSISAVKVTLIISPNCSTKKSLTIVPNSVGMKARDSFFSTYWRACMVWMGGGYVVGLPMPCSSSALMSEASLYRAGGWVNFCSGNNFSKSSGSPSETAGNGFIASSFPESDVPM